MLVASRTVAGIAIVVSFAVSSVSAQEYPPDRRTARGGAPIVSSSASADPAQKQQLLDLLQQLEALQTEVRQLRNSVEVQGHELEQLKSRQRTFYDDVDRRLREAEKRPPGPAAPASEPAVPGPSQKTATPDQQKEYDAAFALLKGGHYERAIKAFRQFMSRHPESSLADNAQYWVAESNYILRNYKLALEEFTKVVKNPASSKIPDAMLKIGFVHYEMGAYDKARKSLAEVRNRFPGSSVARLATARIDKMKKEGH